jgi:hypothetical protein
MDANTTPTPSPTPKAAPPAPASSPPPPTPPALSPPAEPDLHKWHPTVSRETRLGLIVAASFLSLVAAVMVVKSVFKPSAPPQAENAQASAEPPAESPPPRKLPQLDPSARVVVPASHDEPIVMDPTPAVPPKKIEHDSNIIDPELMIAPTVPAEVVAPKVDPTVVLPPADPLVIEPPPVKKDPPLVAPEPVEVVVPKDNFKSNPAKKGPPPALLDPLDRPPADVEAPPVAKNPVIRVGGTEPKKEPPAPIVPPVLEPPPMTDPMPKKEPEVIVPPAAKKDPAEVAPIKIDLPSDEPKKDPVVRQKDKKDPAIVPPPPPDDPMMKDPAPIRIGFPDDPVDPPVKKQPALDPPAKQDAPAVLDLAPKTGGTPRPDAPKADGGYDEDLHTLKPNETYRTLSKQYYNSEAYAAALQRYNREHPGQADYVRVPPIWVLEKKYATEVSAPARAVNYAPPPSPEQGGRPEQVYTVADNGEMLADVAKKSLGSEDQWKRLWEANPSVNPAKLVPGGTRLRLP